VHRTSGNASSKNYGEDAGERLDCLIYWKKKKKLMPARLRGREREACEKSKAAQSTRFRSPQKKKNARETTGGFTEKRTNQRRKLVKYEKTLSRNECQGRLASA